MPVDLAFNMPTLAAVPGSTIFGPCDYILWFFGVDGCKLLARELAYSRARMK